MMVALVSYIIPLYLTIIIIIMYVLLLQVIWKLQPTSEELQIEIIKEALELLGDNKEVRMAENCSASTSSNVSNNLLLFIYLFIYYIYISGR